MWIRHKVLKEMLTQLANISQSLKIIAMAQSRSEERVPQPVPSLEDGDVTYTSDEKEWEREYTRDVLNLRRPMPPDEVE